MRNQKRKKILVSVFTIHKVSGTEVYVDAGMEARD